MTADFPVFAIDPGTSESAFVVWDGSKVIEFGKVPNPDLLRKLQRETTGLGLVIEMIASYGMSVGREVFETCVWIGRFYEAWGEAELIVRRDVKLHLCHDSRAKDSNIRTALIDRFGPPGVKSAPGLTYGMKSDVWQAFALAVYADDTRKKRPK